MSKKIHFAYAIPEFKKDYTSRAKKRFISYLSANSVIYQRLQRNILDWPIPVMAPYSITKNVFEALKLVEKSTFLYNYTHDIDIHTNSQNDIFIGHLNAIVRDKKASLVKNSIAYQVACNENFKGKKILITPYNHSDNQVGFMKEAINKFDKSIFICGKHWIDTWHESPFKGYKGDILQINMAVDSKSYPLIKKEFSPKNRRKFLYIGSATEAKNIKQLELIAKNYPGFKGGVIGSAKIDGWKKISGYRNLTDDFISKLAQEYDIFINASRFDAQATTIIEAMLWGFPIVCTPQSGYTYKSFFKLDTDDTNYNLSQINHIQQLDNEELLSTSYLNRQIAKEQHNWPTFKNKILDFLKL